MQLKVASRTDVGRVREKNEDSLLTEVPLVAVADGMGGHAAGEVASSMALETLGTWRDRLEGLSATDAGGILREAFTEANRAIYEKGQEDQSLSGMGTTLTAGWIVDDKIAIAHVGDSRAYLLRNGELQQLTEDQNVAQELRRRGRISEDEVARSPHRHYLLQAVGGDPDQLRIDVLTVGLQPGDRLLLASDGLYGMLKDADRIRDILVDHEDPDEASRVLVEEANAAGGEDNISVLIVDAIGDGEAAEPAPVVVEPVDPPKDAPRAAAVASKQRRPSRRLPMIAAGVALLAIIVGAVLVTRVGNDTLLVGERRGKVAILKGRPGTADRPARGKVVRVFASEPVEHFPRTVRDQIRAGIPVSSLAEAEQVIANLPRVLGPQDTPTPQPSPGVSPSPGPASTLPPVSPTP